MHKPSFRLEPQDLTSNHTSGTVQIIGWDELTEEVFAAVEESIRIEGDFGEPLTLAQATSSGQASIATEELGTPEGQRWMIQVDLSDLTKRSEWITVGVRKEHPRIGLPHEAPMLPTGIRGVRISRHPLPTLSEIRFCRKEGAGYFITNLRLSEEISPDEKDVFDVTLDDRPCSPMSAGDRAFLFTCPGHQEVSKVEVRLKPGRMAKSGEQVRWLDEKAPEMRTFSLRETASCATILPH